MSAAEFAEILDPLKPQVRQLAEDNFRAAVASGNPVFKQPGFRLIAMKAAVREAERVLCEVQEEVKAEIQAMDPSKGLRLELIPYSEIPRKRVAWCWERFLPFGKPVLLEGDPDQGKSLLTVEIVAHVTTGKRWPDGSPGCEPGGALIVSAEDDAEDTIGPRLDAAGADVSKVYRQRLTLDGETREPTICDAEIALIEEKVREKEIKIVVIDPLSAYLDGDVRVYVDHDVRRALLPLKVLAERTGIALIVIRHWNKSANANALHRGGGSIGITAAARAVLAVAFDPEDENPDPNQRRRILAVAKMNVGARPPSREFRLVYVPEHDTCRIVWGGESKHSANALSEGPKDGGRLGEAREFVEDMLADGPVAEKALKDAARERGIAWRTAQRAKVAIGARSQKSEDGTYWLWALPDRGDAWEEEARS